MPFVPVPATIQVDVIYLLDNQRVENTLYFEKGDGWGLGEIEAFLFDLYSYIASDLLPALSEAIQLIELIARLLDTASSLTASYVPATPPTGEVAGDPAPNNVTYTISFKTGLAGRSFRGRNYVAGLPDAAVIGNTINGSTRTALLAFYSGLTALAASNGATWVVVSRYSGVDPTTGDPIPRVTGVTTPVSSVGTFDTTVDSQRRRLPGRGR
jgi:hypothetical protein